MINELCTANYAGGWTFAMCGNANREARGCGSGIYPITPQTEIVETVMKVFEDGLVDKGRIFHVESEHSAMAACIGVSAEGARSFTATSSNGALYMAENIVNAALYRLPIVMQVVNRTLGPEWNIWAEQGDSLIFRDWGWIQVYCEDNQELVDHVLMAFFISENHRILLPSMLCVDAFLLSHTMMPVLLPTAEEADSYLPRLDLPHRLRHENPFAVGGLALPRVTSSHRHDMEESMQAVPEVYKEAQDRFERIFGRRPSDPVSGYRHEDALILLVASSTMASTAKTVVDGRRKRGEKVGLIKIKMFRPFPAADVLSLMGSANRIAILDRNFALGAGPGAGGIFCQEVLAAMGQSNHQAFVQGYTLGLGGMDVTPTLLDEIVDDIQALKAPGKTIWKGL